MTNSHSIGSAPSVRTLAVGAGGNERPTLRSEPHYPPGERLLFGRSEPLALFRHQVSRRTIGPQWGPRTRLSKDCHEGRSSINFRSAGEQVGRAISEKNRNENRHDDGPINHRTKHGYLTHLYILDNNRLLRPRPAHLPPTASCEIASGPRPESRGGALRGRTAHGTPHGGAPTARAARGARGVQPACSPRSHNNAPGGYRGSDCEVGLSFRSRCTRGSQCSTAHRAEGSYWSSGRQ